MHTPVDLKYLQDVAQTPEGITIDFLRIPAVKILAKNINQCTLTGPVGPAHDFNRCNITSSTVEHLRASFASFESVDIKDCLLIDSEFRGSHFDGLAFVNNIVVRSQFSDSTFNNTSITDCEFVDTRFVSCDFSNLLVKGCRFVRCEFIECVTSNKLFETCLVLDCRFERTPLQLQTITANFGFAENHLVDCPVRSDDPKVEFRLLNRADVENASTAAGDHSPVEQFRIAYFLSSDVVFGSEALDSALDVRAWLQLSRIPSSFALILQDFSEFLLHLYGQNQMTAHPLLMLHTLTSQLSTRFSANLETNPRVSRAIMGVHMHLTRSIEEYLGVLEMLVETATRRVHFVADGPLDASFFYRELAHVFIGGEVRLVEVKPHNSPVELVFEWINQHGLVCLMAAFAASRTKLEIWRLSQEMDGAPQQTRRVITKNGRARSPALRRPGRQPRRSRKLFSYSMGFDPAATSLYRVKARAMLPGSLLAELRLDVNTVILARFRRVLVELIGQREVTK
jgi:uncharacterized protein YjbI with pentapeptide repeats